MPTPLSNSSTPAQIAAWLNNSALNWTAADSGVLAWSFDPASMYSGLALNAGLLYLAAVPIRQQMTVSNILHFVSAAGSGLTSGQNLACLYQNGQLQGVTADQSAAWASTGLKTAALTAPATLLPGMAYAGFFGNGTTRAALAQSASSAFNGIVNAGNASRAVYDSSHTGLTTAPPATLGTLTAQPVLLWAGLS
jgi:hypothetical protein